MLLDGTIQGPALPTVEVSAPSPESGIQQSLQQSAGSMQAGRPLTGRKNNTGLYIAVGIGFLLIAGIAWYLYTKK